MKKMRENIHLAIDGHCSTLKNDPCRLQRVLRAAESETPLHARKRSGKRISTALVFILALLLISSVGIAAILMNHHLENAMDLSKEKGTFQAWSTEDKIALLEIMHQEGISLPAEEWQMLQNPSISPEEKERAATKILTAIYGDPAQISHFTMASHEWGDPFQWTMEQTAWFWETLRAKGLYNGRVEYLLPEAGDLSREQAVQLAREAIQAAYELSDEEIMQYDADVRFFTIYGTAEPPRWLIYLGYADAEAADYSVLLTRDGQVTEDASLYVSLPGKMEILPAASLRQSPAMETPFQIRWRESSLLYLSESDGLYHFLADCPAAPSGSLSEAEKTPETPDQYLPCPYCVLKTEFWSVADKIHFGVMGGELPAQNEISEDQAAQIARDYLISCGASEAGELIPYLRYVKIDHRHYYTVFFARLDREQIYPIYSVLVDAENGDVSIGDDGEIQVHGKG